MMKEQIAKSASEEAATKKSQTIDSVASADASAKATGAAAMSATNKKVNERSQYFMLTNMTTLCSQYFLCQI